MLVMLSCIIGALVGLSNDPFLLLTSPTNNSTELKKLPAILDCTPIYTQGTLLLQRDTPTTLHSVCIVAGIVWQYQLHGGVVCFVTMEVSSMYVNCNKSVTA